jgi:hypothetical protein
MRLVGHSDRIHEKIDYLSSEKFVKTFQDLEREFAGEFGFGLHQLLFIDNDDRIQRIYKASSESTIVKEYLLPS